MVERCHELAVGVWNDRGRFKLTAALLWMLALLLVSAALESSVWPTGYAAFVVVVCTSALGVTIAGSLSSEAAARRRAAAIARELEWSAQHPFEVTGYREWMASDVPLLTVVVRDRVTSDNLTDAVRAIDPALEIEVCDPTTFTIMIPPRTFEASDVETRFGDIAALKHLFQHLLYPLHDEVGIERVAMGGTLVRG